jgi:general stress protein YciG
MTDTPKKSARGFASLSPARRSEIASMGGKTAQKEGRAHKWSSEEAKEAGRHGAAARKLKKIGRPAVQG